MTLAIVGFGLLALGAFRWLKRMPQERPNGRFVVLMVGGGSK